MQINFGSYRHPGNASKSARRNSQLFDLLVHRTLPSVVRLLLAFSLLGPAFLAPSTKVEAVDKVDATRSVDTAAIVARDAEQHALSHPIRQTRTRREGTSASNPEHTSRAQSSTDVFYI